MNCAVIITGEDEPEREPIGLWGQRHLKYIQKCCKPFSNKMILQECVSKQLKADNQIEWVGKMNNIRHRATEIINHDIICN